MTVRLQTAYGKIKEYQTVEWGRGGGEHDLHPAKYISNRRHQSMRAQATQLNQEA